MKTILAWSGGKDSTATAILARKHGIKIDEIVTVMPDPFKCEMDFLFKFEVFMQMKVHILDGPTFDDYFFRIKVRGPHVGSIYGWPFTVYKTCARVMKWEPMKKFAKTLSEEHRFLIGIAKGEGRKILDPNISFLLQYGLTEDDARSLCEEYGLLNPLYAHFKRLGCVRCPKQGYAALKKVQVLEPEKFDWMLRHDSDSPVTFKPKETLIEFMANKALVSDGKQRRRTA